MADQIPGRSVVFGRGPGVDVTIDDPYCSPRHCRITEHKGRFFVEDLGSTNGTRIVRLSGSVKVYGPTVLEPGDRVRIGRTLLPWAVPT